MNVTSAIEFEAGSNFKCVICAERITSLAETSVQSAPLVDFVKVPDDSSTVIVIEVSAESASSTSANGKSETV